MSSQPTKRFLSLWKIGHDTHSIAQICGVPEAVVYNKLSAARNRGERIVRFSDAWLLKFPAIDPKPKRAGSGLIPYAGAELKRKRKKRDE